MISAKDIGVQKMKAIISFFKKLVIFFPNPFSAKIFVFQETTLEKYYGCSMSQHIIIK